jgi:hypothetical protein
MENSIRRKSREKQYGFKTSTTYCNTPYYDSYGTVYYKKEFVSSYRGPMQYVQVGDKKRKKFHSFQSYKYNCPDQSTGNVCEPWIPYIGWSKDYPFHQCQLVCEQTDPMSTYGTEWDGTMPPMMYYALYELGNEFREKVIRDLYSKANAPRWNAAVFLAELDETLVGIHGLFKNALGSLLRGKLAYKNAKHLILHPEELWLWYRYMLIPTMLDVEELIAALSVEQVIDRVQDGDRSEEPITLTGTLNLYGYGKGKIVLDIPWESEVKYGCGGAMDIISRFDPSPWGTSSWDVLMGTWERIPFSFLVDWFINVGDWLASLRSIEVVFAQSYATFAVETKTTLKQDSYYTLDFEPVVYSFLMDRIIDIEPPSLPLIDKRWRNVTRTLDLIALSIGTIKSVLKRRK